MLQSFLKDFPFYFNAFIEIVGALTILATVIVKLTPSPKDDEVLNGFKLKWNAFLAFLPTFGYNKHQAIIEEVKEKESVVLETKG